MLEKVPKKVLNHNKSNKSPSKNDKNSNKYHEKRICKEYFFFVKYAIIVCPKINIIAIHNDSFSFSTLFLTLFMTTFISKNSWYYNTRAINHFCNIYNIFITSTKFTISQPIEDISESILFLSIDIISLNIQFINQSIISINLCNIYYVFSLIANIIISSSLFKKVFYFYNNKYTLYQIFDYQKMTYISIVNRLFILAVIYISLITFSFRDFAFM